MSSSEQGTGEDISEALRSSPGKTNFQRISRLLITGGTLVMRQLFDYLCPPETLSSMLEKEKKNEKFRSLFPREQWNKLYPQAAGVYCKSSDLDIPILYKLLTTFCNLAGLSRDISSDLKHLRDLRNTVYGHSTDMEIGEARFKELWSEISSILITLAEELGKEKAENVRKAIDKLRIEPLAPHSLQSDYNIHLLEDWTSLKQGVLEAVQNIQIQLEYVTDKQVRSTSCATKVEQQVQDSGSKIRMHDQQIQDLKQRVENLEHSQASSMNTSQCQAAMKVTCNNATGSGHEMQASSDEGNTDDDKRRRMGGASCLHTETDGSLGPSRIDSRKRPTTNLETKGKKEIYSERVHDSGTHSIKDTGDLGASIKEQNKGSKMVFTESTADELNKKLTARAKKFISCSDDLPPLFGLSYSDYANLTDGFNEKNDGFRQGGQGKVFKAEFGTMELAIKVFNEKSTFEREQQMSKCRNPFVLPLWDVCKEENGIIVYPYMRNGNLYEAVVAENKIPSAAKRIGITLGCCLGLKYIHDKGYVYRDFKSANVLLDENYNPRLGDYGMVKDISASGSESGGHTSASAIQQETHGYACPIWQIQPGRVCAANDLWGLGVVMLEMLTGLPGSDKKGVLLAAREDVDIYQYLNEPKTACTKLFEKKNVMERIHEAGWKNMDLASKFALLALRCMNPLDLEKRIRLDDLCKELKKLLKSVGQEDGGSGRPCFDDDPDGDNAMCVYCLMTKRGHLTLACQHSVACEKCILETDSLLCSRCCTLQYCLVGNKWSYAICIAGVGKDQPDPQTRVRPDELVLWQDAKDMFRAFTDERLMGFPEGQVFLLTSDLVSGSVRDETDRLLKDLQDTFANEKTRMKNIDDAKGDLSLFVFLSVHCDASGCFTLPGKENESGVREITHNNGRRFMRKLRKIEADNLVVIVNGCSAMSFFATDYTRESSTPTTDATPTCLDNDVSKKEKNRSSKPRPRGFSVEIGRKTFAMLGSCEVRKDAFFEAPANNCCPKNSYFVSILLSALRGANFCFTCSRWSKPVHPCDACSAFRKKIKLLGYIELRDLIQYVQGEATECGLNVPAEIFGGTEHKLLLNRVNRTRP